MNDKQITDEQQKYAEHQILADGLVVYSGPDWVQAFLDAGLNPNYGTIVYVENGKPGAMIGPIVYPKDDHQQPPS
jgi:hypothetical protein